MLKTKMMSDIPVPKASALSLPAEVSTGGFINGMVPGKLLGCKDDFAQLV